MPTTPNQTRTHYAIQRRIDGRYFDGQGWTDDASQAYRTSHGEAVNLAAYLYRITPGWVRAAVISD